MTSESISSRFAQAVKQFAGRTAVSAPAGNWTYAELDRHAHFIAAEILTRSEGTSEPVALLLEHDAPLIAAILGTLMAGKMYLVLDAHHSAAQLTAMLAGSGANLLLTDSPNLDLAHSLASAQLNILPVVEKIPASFSPGDFPEVPGAAGAWLMFTSGSTSAPKGVWQNHRGIVHEADVYAELAGLTPDDRLSLLTSCGLSAAGATLFAALLHGATLCLFHLRSQGTERLADWLRCERITVLHSVPTVFRHLARTADAKQSLATVRLVRLGGEPVLRGDVELFRQQCPAHCRFMQSLSSTETGIISTFTLDQPAELVAARVPAGRAVRGVEVFLVDDNHRPLPAGGEGKIAVRSARLRQGYWRQPELTAEKFLTGGPDPDLRTFISNDLGRFLPDGSLEHLGRADQLVKIRGQRVDLSEVETALLATQLVKEAAVVAREDAVGEKRLAAYFVPHAGTDTSSPNLRRELNRQLPAHMIPNEFVPLEKMPQTAAGKLDRRALPAVATPDQKNKLSREFRPRDVVEKRLARIWESILRISPIGRHDDFFELGGSSLQSVELLLLIGERFSVTLPPSTLVEYNTIEKLAALLTDQAVVPSASPLLPLRRETGGRPLFLIHNGQGDVAAYGLLARRLPARPIYGLQSVGFQGECWPLMSVAAMARRYLPEILAKDPTGPYLLVGSCMGGLVALELAQMLVRQNRPVGLVALIDSAHPVRYWRQPRWKEKIYDPIGDNLRDAVRILRWLVIRSIGLGRAERWRIGYRRFVANMNALANRYYQPKPYSGTLTIFLSAEGTSPDKDRRLWLHRYARDSVAINIPGKHGELFMRPAVVELARELQAAIAAAEARAAKPEPVAA